MNDPNDKRDERLWWEKYRRNRVGGERSDCPGTEALAAFIDGRITETEKTAIETHLAGCGNCLNTVIETRALLRETIRPAPEAVVERARALMESRRDRKKPLQIFSGLKKISVWAAAAGLLLAAGLGGFYLGRDLGFSRQELEEIPLIISSGSGPGWPVGGSRGGES